MRLAERIDTRIARYNKTRSTGCTVRYQAFGCAVTGCSNRIECDIRDSRRAQIKRDTDDIHLTGAREDAFRSPIRLYGRLSALASDINGSGIDFRPTDQQGEVKEILSGRLENVVKQFDQFIDQDVQQFNKEYLADHYGTRKGKRWKVPPEFSGRGGLMYLGEELEPYQAHYEAKSGSIDDDDWRDLVALCRLLEEATDEELVAELGSALLSHNYGVTVTDTPGEIARDHAREHAAYIASWNEVLRDDASALFDAWALALGACDWLELEFSRRAASDTSLPEAAA